MPNPDEIVRILAEEYGIKGERALDEAIRKQKFIDVTPFCAPPKKQGEVKRCDET